ncbi:hypothetical protein PSN45_003148 [Yamadazyma tenuis]|uniref:uncharacterized protein n=1 Tax=Candida tenuis TaxID=2315449 RepID=UPI00279A58F2|nr:hypothetical protein PSN45_003148 [Yamadazyma tenuis]
MRRSTPRILAQPKAFTTSALLAYAKSSSHNSIPNAQIKWYYATDVPLTKPDWYEYKKTQDAKKYVPFSDYDSKRIESHYRKFGDSQSEDISPRVYVSEDRLFQVDVENLHLSPVYWEGPSYETRRGLWFSSDGIPLAEDITREIENGYKDKKPYLFDEDRKRQAEQPQKQKPNNIDFSKFYETIGEDFKSKESHDDVVILGNGKAVVYFNDNKAVLFPKFMVNSYQLPIIRQFYGSSVALMGVEPIQRGYSSDLKSMFDNFTKKNTISSSNHFLLPEPGLFLGKIPQNKEDNQNEQMREVIEDDFEDSTTEQTSTRETDHLVLCVHGIGQGLGLMAEAINIVHDINSMRNTMKTVYKENKKFRNLAYKDPKDPDVDKNNRIQVLPIAWRHRIDFHPEKVSTSDDKLEPRLPTLSQINVEGVRPLRNVVGYVALDILLYYDNKYFNQILEAVTLELNRVYELYMENNPDFKGKVHILGHSLGSAISFDIASRQFDTRPTKPNRSADLLFDVDSLFCVGSPVGVFKLISQKNIVNRSDVPKDFDPRSRSLSYSSPKCKNLYNLYHPCDPIGYRIEPLIKPRFAHFKAQEAPFAADGLETPFKGWSTLTDELQERFSKANTWLWSFNKKSKAFDQNSLGDFMNGIVDSNPVETPDDAESKKKLSQKDLGELLKFNKEGRVDFSLPRGMFDISLLSAISAHVSYFEDKDTAGFIMGELLLSDNPPVKSLEVMYKDV